MRVVVDRRPRCAFAKDIGATEYHLRTLTLTAADRALVLCSEATSDSHLNYWFDFCAIIYFDFGEFGRIAAGQSREIITAEL